MPSFYIYILSVFAFRICICAFCVCVGGGLGKEYEQGQGGCGYQLHIVAQPAGRALARARMYETKRAGAGQGINKLYVSDPWFVQTCRESITGKELCVRISVIPAAVRQSKHWVYCACPGGCGSKESTYHHCNGCVPVRMCWYACFGLFHRHTEKGAAGVSIQADGRPSDVLNGLQV